MDSFITGDAAGVGQLLAQMSAVRDRSTGYHATEGGPYAATDEAAPTARPLSGTSASVSRKIKSERVSLGLT